MAIKMNKNEESLISHALKLYGVQYNDNIKSRYYKIGRYIEVSSKIQNYSFILCIHSGIGDTQIYENRNTSLNLHINIRSFINHWLRCYTINKTINRVAVRKCYYNTFNIAILGNDNCWYYVLNSPHHWVDDWIIYNW